MANNLPSPLLLTLLTLLASTTALRPWDPDTHECALNIPPPLQPHGRFGCPLPLDEKTGRARGAWSPWTHRPRCVNASAIPARPNGGQFCVFTNSQHGIRGVSLITTPEAAADSIDVLNEAVLPEGVVPPAEGEAEAFEVVDIAGKGKGVVATRKIHKYENIMVDYASLLVDLYFPSSVLRHRGYVLLHDAADQLADPDRVYELGKSSPQAGDPIEDVLRTNAFHTELGGEPHMVLFPLVSRINHDCHPNAFPRFQHRSLTASVAASRDIEKGEEITISYLTLGQSYVERTKGLQRWGFKCGCKLCSADPDTVSVSDTRRLKIKSKREQALKAYRDGSAERAVELINEVIHLLEAEGLELLMAEQLENLGRIYWASGDRENGERYARLSLQMMEEQGYIAEFRPRHLKALLRNYQEDSVAYLQGGEEEGKDTEPAVTAEAPSVAKGGEAPAATS